MLKMKPIIIFCLVLVLISCGKDKVILLPEIQHAEISKIDDLSVAYLFYDETQPDSLELNRKNLISTTNWLVNVDKRLTLKQAIPKIKFLQEKKENSSHKKENTKNYFTCNDTSIKNLGFIEFTDIVYNTENDKGEIKSENTNSITVVNLNHITIFTSHGSEYKTNITNFVNVFNEKFYGDEKNSNICLSFSNKLLFQDYITFKSILSKSDVNNVGISNHESIFN